MLSVDVPVAALLAPAVPLFLVSVLELDAVSSGISGVDNSTG